MVTQTSKKCTTTNKPLDCHGQPSMIEMLHRNSVAGSNERKVENTPYMKAENSHNRPLRTFASFNSGDAGEVFHFTTK